TLYKWLAGGIMRPGTIEQYGLIVEVGVPVAGDYVYRAVGNADLAGVGKTLAVQTAERNCLAHVGQECPTYFVRLALSKFSAVPARATLLVHHTFSGRRKFRDATSFLRHDI